MDIEREVSEIKERNRRVEMDKAWERSLTRRGFIAAVTYIFASALLLSLHAPHPFVTALLPTGGYVLSTLTLPFVRRYWAKNKT